MADRHIEYRAGYKYQLAEDYHIEIPIIPEGEVDLQFIALDMQGNLLVRSGYAWDGTSGPVFDTDKNLRASLVHDALYQLMRKEKLSRELQRDEADRLFRTMCEEDGVGAVVAQFYYEALKTFGDPSADPKNAKEVKRAP